MQEDDLGYLTKCAATGTTTAVVRALAHATNKKIETTQSESAQRTYRNFNILLISNPSEATNLANDILSHMREQLESVASCFEITKICKQQAAASGKRDNSVLSDIAAVPDSSVEEMTKSVLDGDTFPEQKNENAPGVAKGNNTKSAGDKKAVSKKKTKTTSSTTQLRDK